MEKEKFKLTIGLEIHAELKTQTKMFCDCRNDPDEKRPNVNICPVCLGHPGTLPVANKEAVLQVLKIGQALGGKLSTISEFDRKNYFYPDIPKGYQISQYKYPFVLGGELMGVDIRRVHLEEDTARSSHEVANASLVDFNRAGVPLMELVTEPCMHTSQEVVLFAKELQLLLQYIEVSEANMEKGQMRLEANISISQNDTLGVKVEVKNLNSFRSVERAIEYELDRQVSLLSSGQSVSQETRGWDEVKQSTFPQRQKEDSHDYRYFPDPDLPKVDTSLGIQDLIKDAPETPAMKRERFGVSYGIKGADIEFYIYNKKLSDLFEKTTALLSEKDKDSIQLLSNYVISDIASMKDQAITASQLAVLIQMITKGEVSSRGAKDILVDMAEDQSDPREIALRRGLFQNSNATEISKIVEMVLAQNATVIAEYKAGKEAALQFLVGQGMKLSKGAANPTLLKSILLDKLTQ